MLRRKRRKQTRFQATTLRLKGRTALARTLRHLLQCPPKALLRVETAQPQRQARRLGLRSQPESQLDLAERHQERQQRETPAAQRELRNCLRPQPEKSRLPPVVRIPMESLALWFLLP
jgi:hypothetical protein